MQQGERQGQDAEGAALADVRTHTSMDLHRQLSGKSLRVPRAGLGSVLRVLLELILLPLLRAP